MRPTQGTRTMAPLVRAPLILALLATAAAEGPCYIMVAASNPCVAAHSTTRALYANYTGQPLYKLCRTDGQCANVLAAADGFADITAQEKF